MGNAAVDTGLFRSSHAALTFAYSFCSDQYDRPAMLKLAAPVTGDGRGLGGLNGAGQAGMIRGEVAALGQLREAMVAAYFSPHTLPCSCKAACCSGSRLNPEWQEAISIITRAALSQLSGHLSNYRLRESIVIRNFTRSKDRGTIQDMAEACGVDRDTASQHNAIISEWLSGTPRKKQGAVETPVAGEIHKALEAVGERLVQAGIV